jgi:hypothetical protein
MPSGNHQNCPLLVRWTMNNRLPVKLLAKPGAHTDLLHVRTAKNKA